MPTKQPRIAITLNEHTREVFVRLAELQGIPVSRVVAELLESVVEPMRRTVALLEAAAEAPKQVRAGLKASAEAVERDLYGVMGYTLGQMDWLMDEMKGGGAGGAAPADTPAPASAPRKKASKTAKAKRPNPHVVTRGSGTPPVPPLRATKTARGPAKTRVPAKGGKHG